MGNPLKELMKKYEKDDLAWMTRDHRLLLVSEMNYNHLKNAKAKADRCEYNSLAEKQAAWSIIFGMEMAKREQQWSSMFKIYF